MQIRNISLNPDSNVYNRNINPFETGFLSMAAAQTIKITDMKYCKSRFSLHMAYFVHKMTQNSDEATNSDL